MKRISIACHETSSCQNIFKNLHSNLFLLKHENIYALVYKKDFFNNEHRRGAEEARRAHNPKDGGPKPPDDKLPKTQVQVSHGIFFAFFFHRNTNIIGKEDTQTFTYNIPVPKGNTNNIRLYI